MGCGPADLGRRTAPPYKIDEELMRNLLALLGFALVTFLAVGWYLDWYHVTPKTGATPGHRSVEIDINSKKIGDDVHKGVEAGEAKVQGLLDKDGKPTQTPAGPPR
jgi:hypothetical protein